MAPVPLVTGGTGSRVRAIAEEIAIKGYKSIVSGHDAARGAAVVQAMDRLLAEGANVKGIENFNMLGMYPAKRFGTPDQVAKADIYLLEMNCTTGADIVIDGGFFAGKALPNGFSL